jgi:ABC-type antimicrobial peptide transport system permease subunit
MKQLLLEVLIVGLITALVGFIVSTALMYVFVKKFSQKKYHFWWQVALSYFITGCLVHLLCQATGANRWYCKNGAACR